jgi:hypothetical protein
MCSLLESIGRLGHGGVSCVRPKVETRDKRVAAEVASENKTYIYNDKMSKPLNY